MSLVDRVKGILLSPQTEWDTIEGESETVGSLYTNYIIPLAAIPAIAQFIGLTFMGVSVLGVTFRTSVSAGLEGQVVRYLLTLAGVYVVALIIDALAPTFGGTKNPVQALKVAAYSSTAAWVAGVFMILPALGLLTILGLYSLYLLYLGLPRLMKAPTEKAMGYTVVVVVAVLVVFMIIGAIVGRMTGYNQYY